MAYVDFLSPLHKKTKRDYLKRVNEFPKAEAARLAKQYGYDYWDGDRKTGFGGYYYKEGYWTQVAKPMIEYYGLKPGDKILDVGCGKGFLLYDLKKEIPGLEVKGIDISEYALEHAKEEIKPFLQFGNAVELPFEDNSFDLVISLNTIHNLYCFDMLRALKEIERVGRKHKYFVVESYRTLEEKTNMLYWVLTGECFFCDEEWNWWIKQAGYTGDHSFIYFE
jgi:protein-L-isoaspartate(D-aspartate) O-methyltransferase